jgi:hypothetical protein
MGFTAQNAFTGHSQNLTSPLVFLYAWLVSWYDGGSIDVRVASLQAAVKIGLKLDLNTESRGDEIVNFIRPAG